MGLREDSKLRMAESKSRRFALSINAHSEKSPKFDLNPLKRLGVISECRNGHRASRHEALPALRRKRSQVRILSGAPADQWFKWTGC